MIRPENGNAIYVSLAGQDRLSALASRDATLKVEVIARLPDGRAKILLNGKPFTAHLAASIPEGSVFRATIRARGAVLELVPIEPPSKGDSVTATSARSASRTAEGAHFPLASRFGLPETPAVLTLISFYSGLKARIVPSTVRRLAAIASHFADRPEEAVEAAAMLEERGISPDDEKVATLASLLRGEVSAGNDNQSGGGRENEADVFAGKRDDGRNWVVIPFTRGTIHPYSGSIRFLIDEPSGVLRGMRIGAVIDRRSVTVEIGEFSPIFTVNPPLSSVDLEKIAVYYKSRLSKFGINVLDPVSSSFSGFGPVDVRV